MKIDTVKLQKLTGKGIVASDDIVINTSKGDKSITPVSYTHLMAEKGSLLLRLQRLSIPV